MSGIERYQGWYGDIVLTHQCNRHCKFCCDKFINTSNDITKIEDIKQFLEWFKNGDAQLHKIEDIMCLGGEPTFVGIPYLQRVCDLIHSYGWKVSLTTNDHLRKEIKELDGYVDYLNISVYNIKWLIEGRYDYGSWDKTELFYSMLLTKKDFPRRQVFDDLITRLHGVDYMYNLKFSTFNKDTELHTDLQAPWIHQFINCMTNKWSRAHEEFPSDMVTIFGTCLGTYYRDCVIKFMHVSDHLNGTPRLYPNGHINRTWDNEDDDRRSLTQWQADEEKARQEFYDEINNDWIAHALEARKQGYRSW
jgi:organic radical activating enzyme